MLKEIHSLNAIPWANLYYPNILQNSHNNIPQQRNFNIVILTLQSPKQNLHKKNSYDGNLHNGTFTIQFTWWKSALCNSNHEICTMIYAQWLQYNGHNTIVMMLFIVTIQLS